MTAPIISVITGVVVAGLSTQGHHATIRDLGISWLIAVGVSFTISLELVLLVVRSLGSAFGDLQRATERVRSGDYTARVPVVATDETGALAQSFNAMVEGARRARAAARGVRRVRRSGAGGAGAERGV
jgi:adenylate cyclase